MALDYIVCVQTKHVLFRLWWYLKDYNMVVMIARKIMFPYAVCM